MKKLVISFAFSMFLIGSLGNYSANAESDGYESYGDGYDRCPSWCGCCPTDYSEYGCGCCPIDYSE